MTSRSLVDLLAEQEELCAELNAQGVSFCRTDLEAALAMLDFARTTGVPATRERNLGNARVALRTIEALIPRLKLTSTEVDELRALRERVVERLREVEQGPAHR